MKIEQSEKFSGVFIEVPRYSHLNHDSQTRCFRFDAAGNAEYAWFDELQQSGQERARWYGHQYKRRDFEVI